jgi:hypothetical protein
MYHSTHTIIHLHIPRLLLVPLWHLVVLASCHEPRTLRQTDLRDNTFCTVSDGAPRANLIWSRVTHYAGLKTPQGEWNLPP